MEAQIASDIHTERMRDYGNSFAWRHPCEAEVLVLPGDIGDIDSLKICIPIFCKRWDHVIFACGNHEYWGSDRHALEAVVQQLMKEHPNFHWLNKSDVTIGGQRFIGGTLWFPMTPWASQAAYYWEDFNRILGLRNWVDEHHEQMKEYLRDNITKEDIVVTHHLPSYNLVDPRFKDNDYNCFFASSCDFLLELQPKAWLYGHTHAPRDEMWGQTRLINNAVGNPDFLCETHDPLKTIEW